MSSDVTKSMNLIKRNLVEIVGEDSITECLTKCGTVNVYWGTAPTGRPHVAYFISMTKLADFLKAGCHVTALFANIHAYLDNMKAPWELLNKRTEYYEIIIKGMLKALKVPIENLRFIRGTEFQLNENYAKAAYQIIGMTSVRDAIKAGCDVVKQNDDPLLSSLVYPLLQALDEEFLNTDVQFGGADQRKIFMYARENLPFLHFAKRCHLMNPMAAGLKGAKMSASEEDSKIDLLETKENIIKKVNGAECKSDDVKSNGVLALLKYVALPNKSLFNNSLLNDYDNSDDLERDFESGKITEQDLKNMLSDILWILMKDLKGEFTARNKESLIEEAYGKATTEESVKDNEEKCLLPMSKYPNEFEALKEQFTNLSDTSIEAMPAVTDKPSILWSCRINGEPHIGYLIPIIKLAKLSQKNWKVVILIEDIGASLHSKHDENQPSWDILPERVQLFTEMFKSTFQHFGGNNDHFEIVVGSEFQLSKKYVMMMYQSLGKVTLSQGLSMLEKLVGDKSVLDHRVSSALYPCIWVLDQIYLQATVRLFGEREGMKDIKSFQSELYKKLNLTVAPTFHVQHENLVALGGISVMSSPIIEEKNPAKDKTSISLYDSKEIIEEKIQKSFFNTTNLKIAAALGIIEKIVWHGLNENKFLVTRLPENGGNITFNSFDEIKKQITENRLHPGDVKSAAASNLFDLVLAPIRSMISKDCSILLSNAFEDNVTEDNKSVIEYSPNKIDLRVAIVESIVYETGSYRITLKVGNDIQTMVKKSLYKLSINDRVLVALKPSTDTEDQEIIGILIYVRDGSAVKLEKRVYYGAVSFGGHDAYIPHLKETDATMIATKLNVKCHAKCLRWKEDGSVANELRIDCKTRDNQNVKLD